MVALCDPATLSNTEDYVTKTFALDWKIDFTSKKITGLVVLSMKRLNHSESSRCLKLDTNGLTIHSIKVNLKPLEWNLKPSSVESFGSCLNIVLNEDVRDEFDLEIAYETSPKSTALQWLEPQQTSDRHQPYVFSQCQAIHARSLVPCQDTPSVKSTYRAKVTSPKGTVVIMGAKQIQEPSLLPDGSKTFHFEQSVPIPSYLLAIASGDLISKKIGPRSSVWAEPSVVDGAAYEFAETEQMLHVAEDICGPYIWGIYDILVLPSSFPYGGMENPCLTFVSPTIIAKDRSMVNVVAHEISHSWTGNLVTNCNWENFWLNEGHTVYVERLIMEKLHGSNMRHLCLYLGYKTLLTEVKRFGECHPYTKLVLDMKEDDPDNSYSSIPYEKGSLLLFYLETKFGKDAMLKWLKAYVQKFSGLALNTKQWLAFLETQLGPKVHDEELGLNRWFYDPGLPPWQPKFEADSLLAQCDQLTQQMASPNLVSDFARCGPALVQLWQSTFPIQRELALMHLADVGVVGHDNLVKIDELLALSKQMNAELRFNWSLVCVKSRYMPILDSCLEFLNSQGRMKYIRPLYRALNEWIEVRDRVVSNFLAQVPFMHPTSVTYIRIDLGLDQTA